jgi:hypothetical protein
MEIDPNKWKSVRTNGYRSEQMEIEPNNRNRSEQMEIGGHGAGKWRLLPNNEWGQSMDMNMGYQRARRLLEIWRR